MYFPEWNLFNLTIAVISIGGSSALIARESFPATRLNYSKFNATSSGKSSEVSVRLNNVSIHQRS